MLPNGKVLQPIFMVMDQLRSLHGVDGYNQKDQSIERYNPFEL